MKKPELLAPAGNLQKLKIAVYYGADAVYVGGKNFSLRTFADNFTEEELLEGIAFAHARGRKVYVAANVYARNSDFAALKAYFCFLEGAGADGVLVSDLGAFSLAKRVAPKLPVHVSTQANTTNAYSARAWKELGASRVVLARELSFKEIAEIHRENPELELEAFVHGAMCISYSGRCYLSDYLDGRSSNRGACVQACRWRFRVQSDEGKRGEWYDVEEDSKGTYLLNSKDLNLSAHLDELEEAGVCSFKIEGRMKSEYYLATVVNAYRRILDDGYKEELARELIYAAHRVYTEGYAFGENRDTISRENAQTKGERTFVAVVEDYSCGRVTVEMRNRFFAGDELEILSPSEHFLKRIRVEELKDGNGEPTEDAKRVQERYSFRSEIPLKKGDILRK